MFLKSEILKLTITIAAQIGQLQSVHSSCKSCFSEFGWKSWKTIGFSLAIAGNSGIVFLDLMVSDSIIR